MIIPLKPPFVTNEKADMRYLMTALREWFRRKKLATYWKS